MMLPELEGCEVYPFPSEWTGLEVLAASDKSSPPLAPSGPLILGQPSRIAHFPGKAFNVIRWRRAESPMVRVHNNNNSFCFRCCWLRATLIGILARVVLANSHDV